MATEIVVTLASAHDLKNINWKKGHLKPYALVWVDSKQEKRSTEVDYEGGCHPIWNSKLCLHLRNPLRDAILTLQIRHKVEDEDYYEEAEGEGEYGYEEEKRRKKEEKKSMVGKAELPLQEVSDAGGFYKDLEYKLSLRRPSGRPQGELRFSVRLKPIETKPTWPPQPGYGQSYNNNYGYPPQNYNAPPYYSQYPAPVPGYNNAPPPPMQGYPPYSSSSSEYPTAAPPSGYPPYGGYPASTPSYPQQEPKKESKYGFGTGLAVGALAGAVGGLAIAEGVDAIADEVEEEEVEEEEEEEEEEYGGDYDE